MRLLLVLLAFTTLTACANKGYRKDKKMFYTKMWEKMDTNNDGNVTRQEYDASHDKHFKDVDTNNDGKITKEEHKAFHKSKMKDCCGKKKKDCGKGGCKTE
ncbi:MAG: hypothetical protein KDD58_11585 [Bdellovibrionales bacterium]|nr:hypothetical protein [Bdellovibrionales bacterium]